MRISDWSSDVCSSDLDRVEEAKDAVQKRAVGRGLFPGDQIVAQRIQILVCLVEKIVKQIVHAALAPVTGTRLWTGVGKFGFKTAWTGGARRTAKYLPRVPTPRAIPTIPPPANGQARQKPPAQ